MYLVCAIFNGPIDLHPCDIDVFGDKMRILAICRGLSNNNKITLRFDIPEEELQALGIWNNRRNGKECVHVLGSLFTVPPLTRTSRGLQESLCISLACYAWKKGGQKTVDELSALPACWPKIGGLTMDVLYQGRREEFPLSPPFMVRVGQLHFLWCILIMIYRLHPMGWLMYLSFSAQGPTSLSSIIVLTCPGIFSFSEFTPPPVVSLRKLLRDIGRNRNGRNGYDMFLGH